MKQILSKNKIYGQPSSKRPRIRTPGEEFLEENLPNEIGQARKHFKTEVEAAEETSVTSGNEYNIYFQPFLEFDLVIGKIPCGPGTFAISIKPVDWANAFIQLTLMSTTEFLQKAIVTQGCWTVIKDDLVARRNIANIILIGVNWMMSKFETDSYIDPWSFPVDFYAILTLPRPAPNEFNIIRTTLIATYAKVEEMLAGEINIELDTALDLSMTPTRFWNDDIFDLDFPCRDDNALGVMNAPFSEEIDAAEEGFKYQKIFNQFVSHLRKHGYSMNTAQIACVLTRSTILNNSDQFVDAVQFSKNIWRRATKEYNIGRIGGELSSTIIRLNFDNKPFLSIGDLCAVQRLAIYRGAKFIHNKLLAGAEKSSFLEQFDSAIQQHNVYPTKKECVQIDTEIILNAQAVLGRANMFLEMPRANSRPSQKFSGVASKSDPDTTPDLLIPQVEIISINGNGFDSHLRAFSEAGVCMDQGEGGNVPTWREDLGNLCYKEMSMYHFRYLTKLNGGTEPILKSRNCTESDVVLISVIDGPDTRSHAFAKTTWTILEKIYTEIGAIAVGKQVLITKLFKKNELRTRSPCGRKSPKYGDMRPLDKKRQQQVLDALRYLIAAVPLREPKLYAGPWSSNLEKLFRTKVLTEGSNEIRARLNAKRHL